MAGSDVRADFWISEYITPWDVCLHGVTKVLAYRKTEYQELYIVETGAYGKGFVLDGKWQSCTSDEFLYHEALVQPALISHGQPRKVLILGSGEGASAREVLRWNTVEQVVMVDLDRELVEACREHLPEIHQNSFEDPRFKLIIGDALQVLETIETGWDVVISNIADPLEAGPACQLFTKEFFEKVRRVLSPQGFFVVQAGPVSPALGAFHIRLAHTLKAVFPNVQPYSSYAASYGTPRGFAMASAQAIDTQPNPAVIDQLLQEKTRGGLRMIDGTALLGLLQLPLYLRRAIAAETQIYTQDNPPRFLSERVIESSTMLK
jgi:spermidine synthase